MAQHSAKQPMWLRVTLSLVAMLAIIVVLAWLALAWMDSFTHHGQEQVVPDLKGLSYNQAVDRLEQAGLTIELSDSVYENSSLPGAVIDQNPKQGAKVKPGRVVYVTINAFSPKTVTLPQLTDISLRQARSVLEGLGITHISVVEVVSEYKDLVLGVKVQGRRVLPGARVAINSTVTLEVGDGLPDLPDSILIDPEATGEASDVERLDLN